MRTNSELERTVERLLSDPAHDVHPLRRALADLYAEYRDALHQMERVAYISDRYQSASRETTMTLRERYDKQLRQLDKMARISDRYQSMMRDLNEALKDASTRDPLTGIGNRRMLMERLKAETARAERMDRPLSIAMADVDRFKAVNDTFGHETGDRALMEVARVILASVRDYDLCGRWGGEEFLVIMPEVAAAEGSVAAERVRSAIEALQVRAGDDAVKLTASFGVAERQPGETLSDFINRADNALFAAKRAGRNRCEIAA
ncbi:GGDEF domain-containing protein [Oxalobacteraceae bacterium OM1]|nr:GGDEF domain-containing protein [Oxalobacteraceae bacterium OM1]